MLLQFSVENFRSIRERAVLSLEASSDKELPENCVKLDSNDEKCLKVITIFGANASGKSNLFKALTASIMMVRRSNGRQAGEPLNLITPFRFDDQTAGQPSSFEYVFIVNGKKYVYGFAATATRITKEYLYVYNSTRASTIFERNVDDSSEYYFPANLKRKLGALTRFNTENKLFLATATAWNCEETKAPLMWFFNGINTYGSNYENLFVMSSELQAKDSSGSMKRFTLGILREADINIADFEMETREEPIPSGREDISAVHRQFFYSTLHRVGNDRDYQLDLSDESNGTVNLFFFAPFIKRAFESGETLCIDEFDVYLHPQLVQHLVRLFNDPEINRANAQLIVSTHTTALLNLNDLRRDQVYFMEKDRKSGCSTLYSLDEFSPRLQEDIQKAYLLGRYGAVPKLGNGGELSE